MSKNAQEDRLGFHYTVPLLLCLSSVNRPEKWRRGPSRDNALKNKGGFAFS
jgi:hypothetical protein